MTPCTSTCPHGTTTCVLAAGHDGQHEVRGDRAPGHPIRTICRWKTNR